MKHDRAARRMTGHGRTGARTAALLAAAVLVLGASPARAIFKDAFVKLDDTAEKAVARAQQWLARTQRDDGSWNTGHGRQNTGIIAYAALALMVNGSVPGEGPYAEEIGKALQFLVNSQKENGIIVGPRSSHGPMYEHALATLALVEAYGMTDNPRIRSAAIKAIDLIVESQHPSRGWRYQPQITNGDISVTVMQVMALRAAIEAGIYVPDVSITRAIRFIKHCYTPREKGFGYTGPGNAAFARTGAGLVCLQTVGLHEDPIIPDVVEYLLEEGFRSKVNHYWYGHYYTSVGLYHYGGDPWKTYYPKIRRKIIDDWKKRGHYRSVLDTSWAILILGVPYRYLPIYQR